MGRIVTCEALSKNVIFNKKNYLVYICRITAHITKIDPSILYESVVVMDVLRNVPLITWLQSPKILL